MTVLTLGSKKGGAGKTTMAQNLAAAAAAAGWKTLLVDIDSQCPSTTVFDVYPEEGRSLAELLQPHKFPNLRTADSIFHDVAPNLDLLTTNHDLLEDARRELDRLGARAIEALVGVLAQVEQDYDIAIIDTPPELGGLQELAVVASDYALAVSRPNSLELPPALQFVKQVRDLAGTRMAPGLKLLGLAWSEVDRDAEETAFMQRWLVSEEPDLPVMTTHVPGSRLPSKGVIVGRPSVLEYPSSGFARAYRALAAEVLGHIVNGTLPPLLAEQLDEGADAGQPEVAAVGGAR